jgi:uncharacterized RDD family membrane protein YckC
VGVLRRRSCPPRRKTLRGQVNRRFRYRYARWVIAPPQYSPDGRWWWNGASWLPLPPPVDAPQQVGSAVRYAGFWLRFAAYLIDAVLLNLIAIPLNLLLAGNSGVVCVTTNYVQIAGNTDIHGVSFSCSPTAAGLLIYFLLGLVYFTFMWSTGATLGQRALKIRIVDSRSRGRLSIGRCLGRYFGFYLSLIPLAIGLIWAGFDPRKRGWHDKMADSVALRDGGG